MAKDYLAMSRPSPQDAEHHGVKGMKWGVGNDKGHEGEKAKTRTIKKADKKFERQFKGVGGFVKVNNAIADDINPRLEKLNNNPKYKDKNLYQDKKLHEKYWNDIDKIMDESFKSVSESFGTNASGTKRMSVTREGFGENATWRAEMVDIQHAGLGLDNYKATFHVEVDANGQMTKIVFDSLQHDFFSNVDEEDFLAHYGVKGMRWGIRRDPTTGARPIAAALDKSAFGRMSKANVDRYNRNQAAKATKKATKTTNPEKQAKALEKAKAFGAKSALPTKSPSKGPAPIPKAPASESQGQKYDRLRSQVKTHGANSLSQEELNFVNARTEAIAKINKMNVSNPGWLTDTSKIVLQETTKTLMKDLAVKAGKQFIVKPLITGK